MAMRLVFRGDEMVWEEAPDPEAVWQEAVAAALAAPTPDAAYQAMVDVAIARDMGVLPTPTSGGIVPMITQAGGTAEQAAAIQEAALRSYAANEAERNEGTLEGMLSSGKEFVKEVAPLALAAAGTYFGAQGLGGLLPAEAAGASAGGTAGGTSLGSGLTPGAGGVTGLTPGTTATGVGGGALGTGITTPIAATSPFSLAALAPATAGGTALINAAGAAGGAAGGASTGGTAAGTAATAGGVGAMSLSKLLKGEIGVEDFLNSVTLDDLGKLAGNVLPSAIGAYASDKLSGQLGTLAEQQRAAETSRYEDLTRREAERYADVTARQEAASADLFRRESERFAELKAREDAAIARQRGDIEFGRSVGEPYRRRLSDLTADPASFLTSNEVTIPVQQGTDAVARAMSVQGNPYGSGTALQEIQDYASNQLFGRLGEEKSRLGTFGGLTSYSGSGATVPGIGTTLPGSVPTPTTPFPGNSNAGAGVGTSGGSATDLASLQTGSQVWNALGTGAANIFNPPKSLSELLKEFSKAGFSYA